MATGAERQRRRRERLRRAGFVDVTVCVPESRKDRLRDFARRLGNDDAATAPGRLIDALSVLKDLRNELRRRGVRRAGVFGSTARGEDRADSDIDVVLDIDEDCVGDVLDVVALARRIAQAVSRRCPGARVEVADLHALKPRLREAVEREAVYAF